MKESQSMSWHAFARSMNELSFSLRQLPRTNECAWCQNPTGSRCSTETISPMRPESTSRFMARVYFV